MFDLPPILSGNSAQQIAALRNYLVRMASQLNSAASAPAVTTAYVTADGRRVYKNGASTAPLSVDKAADTEAVRKNAQELRQLILKTADGLSGDIEAKNEEARGYTDAQIYALGETYLGRSEFGAFTENIESQIVNSARGVVEGYNFAQRIDSAQADLSLIQSYITEIDGEIRRGLVEDPETGENVTGIAISQNLQFTGEVSRGEDGRSYYRLASGQTFGLYTSTGWQFWINGYKRGWYDSVDGMLHVANIVVENALSLGGTWRIVNENGLGIKYTGE